MLNYGFSRCSLYIDERMQEALPEVPVRRGGRRKRFPWFMRSSFAIWTLTGRNIGKVERKLRIHREVEAPVEEGTQAGEMIYSG